MFSYADFINLQLFSNSFILLCWLGHSKENSNLILGYKN